MKKLSFILVLGCAAMLNMPPSLASGKFTESPINKDKALSNVVDVWATVERNTLRYPTKESSKGSTGCATVKYVITAQNEVKDVHVVTATHKSFAQAAAKAIEKWDFSGVNGSLFNEDTPKQTRFEFCKDVSTNDCIGKKTSYCEGDDVIVAVRRSIDTADIGNANKLRDQNKFKRSEYYETDFTRKQ